MRIARKILFAGVKFLRRSWRRLSAADVFEKEPGVFARLSLYKENSAILSGKMRIFREGDDFVKIKMMLKKRKGRIENDKQKGIFCAIMKKTKKKEFFA